MSMPMKSTPRPARIWPMCWAWGFFTKTMHTTPTKAIIGARAPTSRAMSSPVTVVPMLAPMMIHTAWFRVIMPALTKPTTMTVVAEEDWITAVMAAPTSTPRKRLAVSRSRISFILLPAAASRPELIICIPWRNRARPPSSPRISVIPIFSFPFPRSPYKKKDIARIRLPGCRLCPAFPCVFSAVSAPMLRHSVFLFYSLKLFQFYYRKTNRHRQHFLLRFNNVLTLPLKGAKKRPLGAAFLSTSSCLRPAPSGRPGTRRRRSSGR